MGKTILRIVLETIMKKCIYSFVGQRTKSFNNGVIEFHQGAIGRATPVFPCGRAAPEFSYRGRRELPQCSPAVATTPV